MMDSCLLAVQDVNEVWCESTYGTRVCVFGQGFVGLPLSLSFAMRGCYAIGVDVDKDLVDFINNGVTFVQEEFEGISIREILKKQISEKRYRATTKPEEALRYCNNIIVTVGMPVVNGECIWKHLLSAAIVIGRNLKQNDLVIIRSTVVPGTTEEYILPILEEESGLRAGIDFYLAYSSERISEGNAFNEFTYMPTVVAGVNKLSLTKAVDLLSVICKSEIIPASSIKAVETAKVFENAQRDVNIAMAQEFARFSEMLGIDTFEVIKLANTHKRVNILTPGPGVGGYCIPNAFYYIAAKAKEAGLDMDILKLCRVKNSTTPQYIVSKLEYLLRSVKKELKSSKIAVLGLAMKDYSSDDRLSPAVEICKLLIEEQAAVSAYDPLVAVKHDFSAQSEEEALYNADAVLILAKQTEIVLSDCEYLTGFMNERPVCIDTKAVINKTEAEKYGLLYWRI